jgi:myo-inositol-1(or 4)-monophosphatase
VQVLAPYTRVIKTDDTDAAEQSIPGDLPTPEQALADSLKAQPAADAEPAPKKGPVRIRKDEVAAPAAPATPPPADDAPF